MLRHWIVLWLMLIAQPVFSGQSAQGVRSEESVQWYTGGTFSNNGSLESHLENLSARSTFSLIGEKQTSLLKFEVLESASYVIDFRNSNFIGQYLHRLFDVQGQLLTSMNGGLHQTEASQFFLRNGHRIHLAAGHYQLLTTQQSQFNIAPPTPFVMNDAEYIGEIRLGNSFALSTLGILVGLFFYYIVISFARKSTVDFTYAMFILGNIIFNCTTLHVSRDVFGLAWFGGGSWPILFSNIAYIVFVMSLLKISMHKNRVLWRAGVSIISLFSLFIVSSLFYPEWQNELNRLGVGIFLLFGITCGIVESLRGSTIARLYLLANVGFVLLGGIAISQEQIDGLQTIYMSHIGLLAVALEVLFLSCVVSYQMTMLESDKSRALAEAEVSLTIAHTDPLTQLPNRYALEKRLATVKGTEAFIYIDLDGLKQCNDHYGHEMGDRLLKSFSNKLHQALVPNCQLYRISGDEFGLVFLKAHLDDVVGAIKVVELVLHQDFTSDVGVSFGSAHFEDYERSQQAVQAADEAMYVNKKLKKRQISALA
ncbi:diguanylate cyclase [Vibrio amylolyticus]|uniref:diguanylate cyclase n=1 Tax=Vibrio amylolyticus TaxID=2847292 RepID=UPI00354D20A1